MPLDPDTVRAELAARGYTVGTPAPGPTSAPPAPAPVGGASVDRINALAAEQPAVPVERGAFDRRGAPALGSSSFTTETPVERVARLSPGEVARGLVASGRLTAGEATEKFGFPVSDPRMEDLRLRAAGGDLSAIDALTKQEGAVTQAPTGFARGMNYVRDNAAALVLPAAASFIRSTPMAAAASGGLGSAAELYRAAREDPQGTWRALSGKDTPGLQQLGERLATSFAAGAVGELGGRALGLGFSAGVRTLLRPEALEAERVLGDAMAQPSGMTRPVQRAGSELATAATGGAIPPLREPPFALTQGMRGLAPLETVLGRTAGSRQMFQNVRERAMEAANRIRLGYLEPGPDVGPLHQLVESQAHAANVQVQTGAINALGQRFRRIIEPGGGDTALADRLANASTTRPVPMPDGSIQMARSPTLDFDAAKRMRTDLLDQSRAAYKGGLNTAGGELVHAADVVDDSIADGLRAADPSGAMYRQWREANAQTRLNYQRQYMSDAIEKRTTYPQQIGQAPQIDGAGLAKELRTGARDLERVYGAENYQNLVDFADAIAFSQQRAPRGADRAQFPWLQVLLSGYILRDFVQGKMPDASAWGTVGAAFLFPALASRVLTNPGLAKAMIAVARNPENTARTAAAFGKLALGAAAMSYEDDQNARRASTMPPPGLAPILNNGGAGIAPRPALPAAPQPQPGPTPGPRVMGRGPLPVPFPQPTPSRSAIAPGISAPASL